MTHLFRFAQAFLAFLRRHRTSVIVAAGVLILLLLARGILGPVLARRLQPLLRARLLQTFQQRFDSPVSIDQLRVVYDGGLQVEGDGLVVQSVVHGLAGTPADPMLRVRHFQFHVTLMAALSQSPRIHHVRIDGVFLSLPLGLSTVSHAPNPEHEVELEYAEVTDAHVRFAPSASDHAPLTYDLPKLVFHGVSRSRPIRFNITVDNGSPLGITETQGTVGPWNFDDPRLVPITGEFSFEHKDVSSVPGLRGVLTLHGRYSGTVGDMHAEGTTDDPAFGLDVSSRTVPLHTRFAIRMQAPVQTVTLERVDGAFLHSHFSVQGEAVKNRDPEGWRLDTQLTTTGARAEDALTLATKTPVPVLTGALAVHGILRMAAGPTSVSQKLSLEQASFVIEGARFSNAAVQASVNALASRARGNVQDARSGTADAVAAHVSGPFTLQRAVVRFPALSAAVPGATATLSGSYSLDGAVFRFDGTVRTEAALSNMTGGVKHLLLKPFNGMFQPQAKHGTVLPLYVEGVGDVPHFTTRIAGMTMKPPGAH